MKRRNFLAAAPAIAAVPAAAAPMVQMHENDLAMVESEAASFITIFDSNGAEYRISIVSGSDNVAAGYSVDGGVGVEGGAPLYYPLGRLS